MNKKFNFLQIFGSVFLLVFFLSLWVTPQIHALNTITNVWQYLIWPSIGAGICVTAILGLLTEIFGD